MDEIIQPIFTPAQPEPVEAAVNESWLESALDEYFDSDNIEVLAPAIAVELALLHGHIVQYHTLAPSQAILPEERPVSTMDTGLLNIETTVAKHLLESYRYNDWKNNSVQVELFSAPLKDIPNLQRYMLYIDGTANGERVHLDAAVFVVDTTRVFYPLIDDSFIHREDRKGYLNIHEARAALASNMGLDSDVLASMEMHVKAMGLETTYSADNYVFFE